MRYNPLDQRTRIMYDIARREVVEALQPPTSFPTSITPAARRVYPVPSPVSWDYSWQLSPQFGLYVLRDPQGRIIAQLNKPAYEFLLSLQTKNGLPMLVDQRVKTRLADPKTVRRWVVRYMQHNKKVMGGVRENGGVLHIALLPLQGPIRARNLDELLRDEERRESEILDAANTFETPEPIKKYRPPVIKRTGDLY